MSVINTNVKALYTQAALKISGREGATAMQQLSTGKRINSAKDDAAGMAIADRMTQQIRSLNQAVRNAGDAISLIQTAEGATNEITDMLQRMRELSIQAINDTNSGDQRAYLDLEFQQLKQEIVRISDTTEWNGFPLLNGTGGVPQGEQPVYKVQSTPTVAAAATFTGTPTAITEPIEQQVIAFTDAAPAVETLTFTANASATTVSLTVPGMTAISFETNSSDTAIDIAASAVEALNGTTAFVSAGRIAIDNGDGTIDIRYSADDGAISTNTTMAVDVSTDAAGTVTTPTAWVSATTPEKQRIDFTAASTPSPGEISLTFDGPLVVTVPVEPDDTGATLATRVVATLNANTTFATTNGWTASVSSSGVVDIDYPLGASDPGAVTVAVSTPTAPGMSAAAPTGGGTVVIGGVNVTVVAGDTAADVAAKAVDALNAATFVTANPGRLVVDNGDGSISITYNREDADIQDLTFTDTNAVPTGVEMSVVTSTINSAQVTFTGSGQFLKSGQLQLDVNPDQYEIQKIAFGPATWDGSITVGDVPVSTILAGDSAHTVALKVQAALQASTDFGVSSGRTITNNYDGSLTIAYAPADGDVARIPYTDTGTTGVTGSAFTLRDYASVTATYDVDDGDTVTLSGRVDAASGEVIFASNSVAQVDTFTFGGAFVAGTASTLSTITVTVDDYVLTFDVPSASTLTVSEELVAAINADRNMSQLVTAELQRDGTMTLTALEPGRAFQAHAVVTRPSYEITAQVSTYTIDASANAADGTTDTFDFFGVTVTPTTTTNDSTLAQEIKAALEADATFMARVDSISESSGVLTITWKGSEGVVAADFDDTADTTGITSTAAVTTAYDPGLITRQASTYTIDASANAADGTTDTFDFFGVTVTPTTTTNDSTLAQEIKAALEADATFMARVDSISESTGVLSITWKASQAVVAADFDDTSSTGVISTPAVSTAYEGAATVFSSTTTANVNAGNNSLIISGDMTVRMMGSDDLYEDITYRGPVVTLDVGRAYPELPILRASDLIINGITVGPSLAEDDTVSSSNNAGGALAKAVAINRVKDLTGVQAVVSESVLTGTAMAPGVSVMGTLTINGYTSPVIMTTLNNTRESRATVVEAINRMTARTGVVAIDSGDDTKGVRLEAADGRNIEVFFNTAADNAAFARATGLREGLTTGSIALESKVEAPVVLTSTGDINNIGFVAGDYTGNRTVVASSDRSIAQPAMAQISSVDVTGTIATNESVSITINGRTKTATADSGEGAKQVIDKLIAAIQNDSAMAAAVTVTKGSRPSEIYFTSNVPGIEFTVTASTTAAAGYVDVAEVQGNADATNVRLNTGDLVINSVAIPGSRADTDIRSPNGILSGQPDSSGIAIAAAINSVSDRTGVMAEVKPASMVGTTTVTGAPGVFPETGVQSLYINGIEVEVMLTEDEPADTRRENVVAAINRKLDSHGVQATNNGNGVTLTSSDGRNVSVWFDSAVAGLSPSSFGLSTGDEVAQVTTITVSAGNGTSATTASIEINGVTVTTASLSASSTPSTVAAALKSAIETKMNDGSLSNIQVSVFNGEVTVESTIPGSGFTIAGADSGDGTVNMQIATTTANSLGGSPVTGIWNGNVNSEGALTMYSGVELISDSEFTVSAGTNGYADPVHWRDLGFTEGTFGGRSSIDMSPPRVGRMTFQVGATMNQSIHIDFADFGKDGIITGDITGDVDLWNSENRVNRIDNREAAQAVLTKLDTVLDKVNGTRATMGAVMNRLEHVIDNLMNVSMNSEASRSQIEDADYAAASTELARTQIMQQAATSVLAQANADQQNVLKLLQ